MTAAPEATGLTVIDASVAVKWMVPEAGSREAVALLDRGSQLLAPSLIRVEVAAAVIRQYREKKLSEPEARKALDVWNRLLERRALRLVPTDDLFSPAIELSFRARHALPDCLYFAVAEAHSAHIITADKAMADRGRKIELSISLLATEA